MQMSVAQMQGHCGCQKALQRHSFLPSNKPRCYARGRLTLRAQTVSVAPDHLQYIQGTAGLAEQQHLEPLLKVLQAQNQEVVSPTDRSKLHPLVIPLTAQQFRDGQTPPAYTCLLRQATLSKDSDQVAQVVQMARGSSHMTLIARNITEYLHRALAEEDSRSGPAAIAEAAGQAGQQLYTGGDAGSNLYAYLTRKAGMYPDVVEQLVANHLDKNDKMSALITAEWYMRPKHFPGWARPYEFTAGLYQQLGRLEESRDSARVALRMPWWTVTTGFEAVRQLAGLEGDASTVQMALKEQTLAANGALPPGAAPAKDDRQVLIDDAEFLMNRAAAGDFDWDDIRSQVAEKYEQAGLPDIAALAGAVQ